MLIQGGGIKKSIKQLEETAAITESCVDSSDLWPSSRLPGGLHFGLVR